MAIAMDKMNELAETVFNALGGTSITMEDYQNFLDALAPAKDVAKNNAVSYANKLHDYLKVGYEVSYLVKSLNAVFTAKVEKITDKRFHVDVKLNTKVLVKGKPANAEDVTKIGKKYVAFEAIQTVNGASVEQFIASEEQAQRQAQKEAKVKIEAQKEAQKEAKVAE